MSRAWRTRATALIGIIILFGCGGGGGTSTGTLAIHVTDAPFPGLGCLETAIIVVDEVKAKAKGESEGEGGWVDIPLLDPEIDEDGDEVVTLDVLQLRDGLTEALAFVEVPTGAYSEVRLHLKSAKLTFADDAPERDFKVPSGMSSGLKIKIDPPLLIAADQTAALVFDVDLTESFHTAGLGGTPTCDELKEGEGKVIFHPVVRVLNESDVGMVSGTLHDDSDVAVADAEIAALPDDGSGTDAADIDDTTPKSFTTEEGGYALLLPADTYDLYARVQDSDTWTQVADDVVVTAGDTQTLDLVLTAP